MSPPTKRSSTTTTTTGEATSNPNPNPTSSPPSFPPMKKAKSQALALDPKNGLHHQDFNNNDVVFDHSSMTLDDSSAPSPAPAANLARKKAQPPQPAKKLVIKLVKGLFLIF